MAYKRKTWKNDSSTPLNADGLNDFDNRVGDEFDRVDNSFKAGFISVEPTSESTITIGGTKFYTGSVDIKFDKPFVGSIPAVTATPNTSGSHFMSCGTTGISREGFTINVSRINEISTGVNWIAVQQTD